MSESHSTTYQYLLAHYGPLLTLKHVAEVMHSTPNGIRMAMARKKQSLAVALSDARRRLGRRVYFEARVIAELIDQGFAVKTLQSNSMSNHSAVETHLPLTSSQRRCHTHDNA